ncbi:MAG TPA: acetyl-CoA hydrolase/transferase C-terminal domain-containing protein [Myxococcota bacterium]|nr:acetyl-CoA hydrolase/transferase C-terminal domain-containing protein [Myxococcota bacterium]
MDAARISHAKRRSPAEAAALVRTRDSLAFPLGPGQPMAFLHALGERDDFRDLQVFGALLLAPFKLFTRRGVTYLSGFYGPVERGLEQAGYDVRFVVADFRRYTTLARQMAPRVMATAAAPPDANGHLSLSLHAGATVGELHRCGRDPDRMLVVEVNSRLPRTLGLPPDHPHCLHRDEVDVIVESDDEPVALPEQDATEVERAIAEHVSHYIPNGATLQTGIGGIPSAVVELLAEGSGGDYGVHSEMFTTGLMKLHLTGKITNKKGIYDGVSIATFALGTKQLYTWLDGQEAVRFLPVEFVNEPGLISRNRNMISINGALSVDLAGQVAADTLGVRQFSGIGGHEDFVAGASFAPCGRSLICLPSTATVAGERVSRIAATFAAGTMITTPRHQVDVVITEHGAAELAGKTMEERAQALIAIADPALRPRLREEAAATLAGRGSH